MALEKVGLQAVLEDENFQAGLKRYLEGEGKMISSTEQTSSVLSSLGSIAGGVLVAGIAAATVALSGLFLIGKQSFDATKRWGEQLDSLGDQFGLSGKQAAAFTFLANKMGLSVDEMGMGLRSLINGLSGMADRIKSGSKTLSPFEQALKKIGVAAFDSKGKLKTFDALLPELMDKFSKLPAGVNASALAMDLFGTRGGTKFLDFLRTGSEGLEEATQKVEEFGTTIFEDTVPNIEEFGFAMNEMNAEIGLIWSQIGVELLPVLRDFVHIIKEAILPALSKWIKEQMPALRKAILDMRIWFYEQALPALKAFWKYMNEKIFPILRDVATIIRKVWEGKDVSTDITALAKKIGDELKRQWPKIEAALNQWVRDFWNWLFGSGGVLSQVSPNMDKLSDKIQQWSSDPNTQRELQDIGKQIGQGIIQGVKDILSQPQTGSSIASSFVSSIRLGFTLVTVPTDIGANVVGGIANALVTQIAGQSFADQLTPAFVNTLKTALASLNPAVSLGVSISNLSNAIRDAQVTGIINAGWTSIRDAFGFILTQAVANVTSFGLWAFAVYNAARQWVQDIANQFINFVGTMADALYNLVVQAINSILFGGSSPSRLSPAGAAVTSGGGGTFAPSYGGNSYNFNMTVNSQASAGSVVRDFGIMRSLAGA